MKLAATLLLAALPFAAAACGGSSGGGNADDTGAPADTSAPDDADTGGVDVILIPDGTNQPPDVTQAPQALGGVCQRDADCLTGYCNTFPQGGYCTQRCGDGMDACPDSGVCLGSQDSDGARRRLCFKPCIATTQCRLDQWCPPEAGVCTPRCREGDCGAGYVCNPDGLCEPEGPCVPVAEVCGDGQDQDCDGYVDNGCSRAVDAPAHVRVVDMGTVKVGGSGLSRTLSFFPSAGAASFTVVALDEANTPWYMTAYSLDAPGGVDLLSPGPAGSEPNRSSPAFGVYTLMVPNSDQVQLAQGRYEFNFYRYGNAASAAPVGEIHVWVLENLREAPSASTIDLNLWFVGIPGLSAASAPNDTRFGSMMTEFRRVLGNAGISVGEVRYFDVTGPEADIYTIVDTGDGGVDEHAELLALSAALPAENHGVNLFFVQAFSGWGLLGKAGGIPGPPLFHGTWESGVVVSLDEYLNETDPFFVAYTAETMAHELGHQLGLYHPTEQDGRSFDHILDTPECPAEFYDSNGDGLVDPIECEAVGGLNLMFWTSTLHDVLSDAQKRVLHLNPAMRD